MRRKRKVLLRGEIYYIILGGVVCMIRGVGIVDMSL